MHATSNPSPAVVLSEVFVGKAKELDLGDAGFPEDAGGRLIIIIRPYQFNLLRDGSGGCRKEKKEGRGGA